MPRQTIEGDIPALVPMLVIRGTVVTGPEFVAIGSGEGQRLIPNPEKFSYSVGETVMLDPSEVGHLVTAGFIRAPGQASEEVQTGSWRGATPPGVVRPS